MYLFSGLFGVSCSVRMGVGVFFSLGNYISATGASARFTLAALFRRRGLGVAVMLGVVVALGVVVVLSFLFG